MLSKRVVPSSIRVRSQAFFVGLSGSVRGTHGVPLRACVELEQCDQQRSPASHVDEVGHRISLSWRMTAHAHMYSALRTSPRPPLIARCPRFLPLSRDQGASPTREAKLCYPSGPVREGEPPGLPRLAARCRARCGRGRRGRRAWHCPVGLPGIPSPAERSPSPARQCGAWWTWR